MKSRYLKFERLLPATLLARLAFLGLGAALTSCAGYSYGRVTVPSVHFPGDDGGSNTSTATPTPSPSPSPTPSPTPLPSLGVPPITFRVGAVGYNSTSVKVQARKVLKVRFTPGIQDENVAGTGFSPQYSKMGVYVGVGTNVQPTEMLPNGLMDAAKASHTFDLSSSIPKTCSASDSECREDVEITISKPNYDYWCLNYYMYCPWSRIHDTHPWHGNIEVQTDDTDPLQ